MRPLHGTALFVVLAVAACDEPTRTPTGGMQAPGGMQATVEAAIGKIAYIVGRGSDFDIYVGNADGTGLIDLSNNDHADGGPVFSPNGRRIAFYSDRDGEGGELDIYVMNVDGTGVERLTAYGSAADPNWSPSGQRIAFDSGHEGPGDDIYVMNADGTAVVNLTNTDFNDWNPVWSPSGRQIAFASDRDADPEGGPWEFDIYVMDADGGNVRRLTMAPGLDAPWSWSPDGRKIAFLRIPPLSTADVYVINADGSGETRLTDAGGSVPSWAPHGRQIAFSRNNRPFIMNADGSDARQIPVPPELLAGGGMVHPNAWSHR
jgi:Tol biopolymer transport system component